MTEIAAIKEIMKSKGLGTTALARRLGVNQSTMAMRLSQKNISIRLVAEILSVMDYKVVLVPSETRMREGWVEIE